MKNRILIILFIISFNFGFSATDPVKIRRICSVGADVNLFWYSTTDACTQYKKYFIWARIGKTGPFSLIDSISSINQDNYTHLGANATGAKDWNYFVEYRDSCGPPYSAFSDTFFIDREAPDTILIDSVSIDINTNKVIIGWGWNHSPDFKNFIVYRDSVDKNTDFYLELTPPGGTRDTFWIDNRSSSDPSKGVLLYDITSVDSCEKPQVFGFVKHGTIFLKSISDTCKKENTLSWTHYIGWASIKKYYIFKRISPAPNFTLIDSVLGNVNSYTETINLGEQIEYYVRAVKDDPIKLITSSSNVAKIITRKRVDPINTYLSSVSVRQPENNIIEIRFSKDPNEEAHHFDLYKSIKSNNGYTKESSVSSSSVNNDYTFLSSSSIIDPFDFKIVSADLCSNPFSETLISGNIVLSVKDSIVKNKISWSSYYYWDSGVESYNLYRGTGLSNADLAYELIATLSSTDTSFVDENIPSKIGAAGLCYFVRAIQKTGSSSGKKEVANSNAFCLVGKLIVYIPNAFNPEGVNKTFKPGGSYIDYANSSVEIFDRWGGKTAQLNDLTIGWDGTDINGKMCSSGVYFYKMIINSPDGQQQIKSGTVTLLN